MTDCEEPAIDPPVLEALRALLTLDEHAATVVRAQTPPRRRARRQDGPSADYR